MGELAAYCKTLAWVGTEHFGRLGRDFGSLGVLIAVGVKPAKRIKLWCEPVQGPIPTDVWEVFVNLLEGAGGDVRPTVTAPVAFALECLMGAGSSSGFPVVPMSWQQAVARNERPLDVPDELFELVFPD